MRDVSYLTELRKGQIIGARMAGASVTKAAELLGFSRATISRAMTKSRSTEKPPATEVVPVGLPNVPTETDVY